MRRFQLNRIQDDSGVSGTGVVAQGVEFDNGFCAMSWLTPKTSVAVYPNVRTLQSIHGHGGHTVLEWIDDDNEVTDHEQEG